MPALKRQCIVGGWLGRSKIKNNKSAKFEHLVVETKSSIALYVL